jgi:hypothetical protein
MPPFLSRKDRTQAARPERAEALYSAKCRKSVRKLLISVSFVHFCLIYIKKMQKRHTFFAEYLVDSRNSSNFAASKG